MGCIEFIVIMLLHHILNMTIKSFVVGNDIVFVGKTIVMRLFKHCNMLHASFSMLLYIVSALDGLLLVMAMELGAILPGVLLKGQFISPIICSSPAPSPTPDTSVSKNCGSFSLQNLMHASLLMIALALLHGSSHAWFHFHTVFMDVHLLSGLHTSTITGE